MRCGVAETYVIAAEHPRRGGPLRVTDKAGALIGVSGDLVRVRDPKVLESLIRNGYAVRVPKERE